MRALTERDKTIIRQLLDAKGSGTLSLHDFIQKSLFAADSQRALIIQTQGHYAVFFLTPDLFDAIDKRNEEVLSFLNVLAFLQELQKEGYIISYRMATEKIYFFQERFVNPKTQNNSLVLNDQGDYSSAPDSIHDRNKKILYKGLHFHGDLFKFILNGTTGLLIISEKLSDLLTDLPAVDKDANSIKQEVTLTKINLLLTVCMLAFSIAFFCFWYFYKHTSLKQMQTLTQTDSLTVTASPDSNIQIASLPSPSITEDSAEWRGVDISKWNGNAASELGPDDSITFVICKATEGITDVDPDFDNNWQIIRNKKYILGAYHFYISEDDPVKQAQHFLTTIQKKGKTDMVPIVDIEHQSLPVGFPIDNVALQNNILQFLTYMENKCNCIPMIYTNGGFANQYLLNRAFNKYPLWLAAYTDAASPPIPYAWKERGYKIWQKRNSYQLNTYVYDFDVFYGKKADLYK
jgi:GH25 family lysozyme M1 (1,4-beta-N-acetylmuramidase)